MSWQDLPIYSRDDGSFIIFYNNAPYHVAKTEGGGSRSNIRLW